MACFAAVTDRRFRAMAAVTHSACPVHHGLDERLRSPCPPSLHRPCPTSRAPATAERKCRLATRTTSDDPGYRREPVPSDTSTEPSPPFGTIGGRIRQAGLESDERVRPSGTRKPRRVRIAGVKFGLMLDRPGGKVPIRRQVAGGSRRLEKSEQDVRVTVYGVNENRLGPSWPGSDARASAADIERIDDNLRIRGDTDESRDHHPGKTDTVGTVHRRLPPLARLRVSAGLRIVGMQQQIDVGNNHGPYRRAVSSDSISSTSWLSRSLSTPGRKPNE